MNSIKQPEPQRIVVATAIVLVLILVFAWKVNQFLGICVLPFATFGVAFAFVRLAAPWYVQRKALGFIRKRNGRVAAEDLTAFLTPVTKSSIGQDEARQVVVDFLKRLEESGVIEVLPDGTVIKSRWGGRTR